MRLADRMAHIGTETAFEAANRARALEAKGRDIIHLHLGEPDFDTPRNIIAAAKRALDEGWTHYAPPLGLPALRQAIAADAGLRRGIDDRPCDRRRHAGREAHPLVRADGARGAGRRGHRARPRLPDLRVDDPIPRGDARAAARFAASGTSAPTPTSSVRSCPTGRGSSC